MNALLGTVKVLMYACIGVLLLGIVIAVWSVKP